MLRTGENKQRYKLTKKHALFARANNRPQSDVIIRSAQPITIDPSAPLGGAEEAEGEGQDTEVGINS